MNADHPTSNNNNINSNSTHTCHNLKKKLYRQIITDAAQTKACDYDAFFGLCLKVGDFEGFVEAAMCCGRELDVVMLLLLSQHRVSVDNAPVPLSPPPPFTNLSTNQYTPSSPKFLQLLSPAHPHRNKCPKTRTLNTELLLSNIHQRRRNGNPHDWCTLAICLSHHPFPVFLEITKNVAKMLDDLWYVRVFLHALETQGCLDDVLLIPFCDWCHLLSISEKGNSVLMSSKYNPIKNADSSNYNPLNSNHSNRPHKLQKFLKWTMDTEAAAASGCCLTIKEPTFILDTNILIDYSRELLLLSERSLLGDGDGRKRLALNFIVPSVVVDELHNLQKRLPKQASLALESLTRMNLVHNTLSPLHPHPTNFAAASEQQKMRLPPNKNNKKSINNCPINSANDDEIISLCKKLHHEIENTMVVLLTDDQIMRLKAKFYDFWCVDWKDFVAFVHG